MMETRTPRVGGQPQRLGRNETEEGPPGMLQPKMGHSRNLSVMHTDADALGPRKLGKISAARGSVGLPTGATSGEVLTDSGPARKRKTSVAPTRAPELFRDPSVQMAPDSNYIDSKAQLHSKPGLFNSGAPGAFATA